VTDLNKLAAPLTIDQIDFRVQSINKGGYATILAYKDARVDMQRLDDAVGPLNWKREHTAQNHNCIVSLWNKEIEQWVSKEDTGTQSNTEAAKGLASDSFKRACFNWGIGRELYDYPLIQIKLNNDEFKIDGNKAKAEWKFQLKKWTWGSHFDSNQKLCILRVKDEGGKVRFEWYRLDLVKEVAQFILSGLASGDFDAVGEAYSECAEFEQNLLWTAKSKGGWFDMEQKKTIRAAEYAFANGKEQSNTTA
jgi:hypothetical protein